MIGSAPSTGPRTQAGFMERIRTHAGQLPAGRPSSNWRVRLCRRIVDAVHREGSASAVHSCRTNMPVPVSKRFRTLLPVAQFLIAVLFGGVGLWQRHLILNQSEFVRNSTDPWHVWPWPWRFAEITNTPAFFAGLLLSWPFKDHLRGLPEWVQIAPSLLFVPPLWYWFGAMLDRQRIVADQVAGVRGKGRPWVLLSSFMIASVIGAVVPSRYLNASAYIAYGVLLWIVLFPILVARSHSVASQK